MKTNWFHGMGLLSLLMASTASSQANDIVNFLRAVNGPAPGYHQTARPVIQPVGHHDDHNHGVQPGSYGSGYGGRGMSSGSTARRGPQFADRGMNNYNGSHRGFDGGYDRAGSYDRVDLRHHNYAPPRPVPGGGSGRSGVQLSFQVSSNGGRRPAYGQPVYYPSQQPGVVLPPVNGYPSVPAYPSAPSYSSGPGYSGGYSHQMGQIVDCQVPLATCVRVEDAFNIAPNAVPVIVAVRDPQSCSHGCREQLVYIQVYVPPCPPRCVNVSPCRTRVTMDYGRYQVDIKSGNGLIVVDYDN